MKTKRWWLWLPMLAVAAWLALGAEGPPPASASAPRMATPASVPAHTPEDTPEDTQTALVPRQVLVPEPGSGHPRDLFAPRSWAPPPAAPAAPASPAPPAAPPLPYTFLGKKHEDGQWEVYLGRDGRTLIVREGAVLDNAWRVDRVEPPRLALTYLPLGEVQAIAIGDVR
jgi:hypothetical protein